MLKPHGLRYVSDQHLIWKRLKKGKYFRYVNKLGQPISSADQARIEKLVIPPAWRNVRLSPSHNGHILAVGFDAKGRKQYIYHPQWVAHNQQHKFDSLKKFGEILPTLRETVNGHMRQHDLTRERILATVVWLLEHTFIRVGNKTYAKENHSYGLTTMRTKHVDVKGQKVRFSFKGKSNVYHELAISNPRVAATVKECIELPGYELFKYLDEDDYWWPIDSADVNEYLKTITGESLSAKDFRTWGGTTIAGDKLFQLGEPSEELPLEKAITQVVQEVSEHLGNTPAVCRQYYIHPQVIKSYEQDQLRAHFNQVYRAPSKIPSGLTKEEFATLSLL
jgi:DNA topoisomerase-1